MNISKKALMSFLMTLTSLIAMAQPYYHVMKQDGNNLTEEAMYDSKNYKIRVDMVPAEEKPKDAIGGKISILRYDCDISGLKRSFYFTKNGNVYYSFGKKKFFFASSQTDVHTYYNDDKNYGSCAHFQRGRTLADCIDWDGSPTPFGNSETDFYFTDPKNLPKLQEDLGNERWAVLSYCEWDFVMRTLGEAGWSIGVRSNCFVIDTTPGKSLLKAIKKENKSPYSKSMTWQQFKKYEAQGLVCLPASGYRNGWSFDQQSRYGYYWSCTPEDRGEFAYGLFFTDKTGSYNTTEHIKTGLAVRLVILADEE